MEPSYSAQRFATRAPNISTLDIYNEGIELLVQERLTFWDAETKERFPFFCQKVEDIDETEE